MHQIEKIRQQDGYLPIITYNNISDRKPPESISQYENVIAQKDTKTNFVSAESSKIDQDGKNNPFYKWFILNYVGDDMKLLK
ncbi:MAG: hypothetical protein LIO93_06380 [Bacteroidales bacterium]|nr:hypothetical protein [Bacteroidales bacterium]